jgi:putative protease
MELLAPAGSTEALDAAVACGADAVYLGLKSFNARMRSANFAYSQFEAAVKILRRSGRRVYVTLNTVFEQREAGRVYQLLKYLASVGPDAVIIQDFGVLAMAREFSLALHASTQMNIACARGANALSRSGVSRAVLARELSLSEIQSIRMGTNLELEVFVHGALCVSDSGLCLFSSYLGGKSANRGMCTQACRRLYRAGEIPPEGVETGKPEDGSKPAKRRPEFSSGYFFSTRDLSLIDHVTELAEAGVHSLKIEGRMKSAEYVGTVVSAYRLLIDSLDAGEEPRRRALEKARLLLKNDFARAKTEYHFVKTPKPAFLQPDEAGGTGIALGPILEVSGPPGARRALLKSGAVLSPGDSLRFHRADDSRRETGKLLSTEPSGPDLHTISVPDGFEPGDTVYLIQTRQARRFPHILPSDLSSFHRRPGRDRAPEPARPKRAGKNAGRGASVFPDGVYAVAASVEDLYVMQSIRPAAAILPLNENSALHLLGNDPLPFRPGQLIISLNPYFPQDAEAFYAETIPALLEKGYRAFMPNNPGHFSLFGPSAVLAAGPWLYTFNRYAASFVMDMGADYAVTPLENNRQNLEKTWDRAERSRVFVTLFAWPPLFRVRADLGKIYPFRTFGGGRGERFSLAAGGGETVVIPETPFSIVDKRPFLEAAGFRRFILDFSGGVFSGASCPLKKHLYRDVMKAVENGVPLSGSSRFNWKDGFFQEKESGV